MTYGFYPRQDVILPPAIDPKVTAIVEAAGVVDAYLALVKGTGRMHPNLEDASAKLTAALAAWEAKP